MKRKIPRGRFYWTKNRKIERHENLIQKLLNRTEEHSFRIETLESSLNLNIGKIDITPKYASVTFETEEGVKYTTGKVPVSKVKRK